MVILPDCRIAVAIYSIHALACRVQQAEVIDDTNVFILDRMCIHVPCVNSTGRLLSKLPFLHVLLVVLSLSMP